MTATQAPSPSPPPSHSSPPTVLKRIFAVQNCCIAFTCASIERSQGLPSWCACHSILSRTCAHSSMQESPDSHEQWHMVASTSPSGVWARDLLMRSCVPSPAPRMRVCVWLPPSLFHPHKTYSPSILAAFHLHCMCRGDANRSGNNGSASKGQPSPPDILLRNNKSFGSDDEGAMDQQLQV